MKERNAQPKTYTAARITCRRHATYDDPEIEYLPRLSIIADTAHAATFNTPTAQRKYHQEKTRID